MREIFYPSSVAVIGVSTSPDNMGQGIVFNLTEFGFQGIIYEVGPKGGVFAGRRIYKSVLDIPDAIDLAVILTPARVVPHILEECGQKGIRWAVVESAGFREYGAEGKKIEEDIVRVSAKWGFGSWARTVSGSLTWKMGSAPPSLPYGELSGPEISP